MPMVVFFGTGPTRQAANNMASKCALGYLRNQLDAKDPDTSDCNESEQNDDDEDEREVFILQVVDADKCNAAITQSEGEVAQFIKKYNKTKSYQMQ